MGLLQQPPGDHFSPECVSPPNGARLFAFTRLDPSQWKSARTTNATLRQMRKVDGWETLSQPIEPMPLDLAA